MPKVYRPYVLESVGKDGVFVHFQEGHRIVVEGVEMVHAEYGWIVPADGWHDSLADATREAASIVHGMSQVLAAQAAKLLEQANGEKTKEG